MSLLTMTVTQEIARRMRKSVRLGEALRALGVTDTRDASPRHWSAAVEVSGVRRAPSQATQAAVTAYLDVLRGQTDLRPEGDALACKTYNVARKATRVALVLRGQEYDGTDLGTLDAMDWRSARIEAGVTPLSDTSKIAVEALVLQMAQSTNKGSALSVPERSLALPTT